MALCPEHSLIDKITTQERKDEVAQFLSEVINLSEVERAVEAKKIRGVFTGAYVIHPFTNEPIPIWIADYVLAGYGTELLWLFRFTIAEIMPLQNISIYRLRRLLRVAI